MHPSDWFERLVKAAYETTAPQILQSPAGKTYAVKELIGTTLGFKLYACDLPEGDPGILKIALTKDQNPMLDREAYILSKMSTRAGELEKINKGSKKLNYQYFFPFLYDGFVSPEQKDRRINILAFPKEIEILSQLHPLSKFTERGSYFDPRSSAWVIGKSLKLLVFAHSLGITIRGVYPENMLIETNEHGVIFLDWSNAEYEVGKTTDKYAAIQEIKAVGKIGLQILGADDGNVPLHRQLQNHSYTEFVRALAKGDFENAREAHKQFYELIWSIWPRQFHPFTLAN